MKQRFAVGALAEFVHRRGHLHARLEGRASAEEGIKVQRRLQADKPETYTTERAVRLQREIAGCTYTIGGRIDGCDVVGRLLEEYKTTRADAQLAHDHHASAHWAQIQLYAGLLVEELQADPSKHWTLRLLYCHPDSLEVRSFERCVSGVELTAFLDKTLAWLATWLDAQRAHEAARDRALAALEFPHEAYRPHQRALARRAFQALRDREHLLLEAPTGSGKTIGLLYPAVKALAATEHEKIFFLTSRNTGAKAAVAGCARLDPDRDYLRYVQLISKEQACLVAGMPCDPERCQYANGYYDRRHAAVSALLETRAMGPDQVRSVAEAHQVCPFELSLDAATWADVLIGDYNYVFDPVVHLQRFAANPNIALLVDESHQLSSRSREMLSLTLSRGSVRRALSEALPAAVAKRVRAIDRNLRAIKRDQAVAGEQVVAKPAALLRAIARLADELTATEVSFDSFPAARDLMLDCFRWARAEAWYDEARCIYTACAEDREFTLKRVHLDPGAYLRQVLDGFGGHIRFSGTVSPLALYQRLHGMDDGAAERAGSPFATEQLDVVIVDDVPTYWRARDRSLARVVALIGQIVSAHRGNYLIALPSFAYLGSVAAALIASHPQLNLVAQVPGMSLKDRADFIHRFHGAGTMAVGLVVMGGVFAESVDFPSVAGVVCVGVGLPPPDLARKQLALYFDAQGADGHAVAFQQPAMTKILQMAGRLLRDPGDRGVLCLVDARFKDPAYQRFFPAHWDPRVVGAAEVATRLDKFWQGAAGSPRLRAL